MYVWIACDLSDSLGKIREECMILNKDTGASEVAFSLPQHISLKISFMVDDNVLDCVLRDLNEYLSAKESFSLKGPKAELSGNIIWLRFSDSEHLSKIHSELDDLLLERYGVPLHKFDKCFAFHSTLFIDDDEEKLLYLYRQIRKIHIPGDVKIDRFIVGISDSGKAGEYRVLDVIPAKSK